MIKVKNFNRLILHKEVRWLSKGNCLVRFIALFDVIIQFLNENGLSDLANNITIFKPDIAYLTDLFSNFNELNHQLQGDKTSLIKAKSQICGFIMKLKLLKKILRKAL